MNGDTNLTTLQKGNTDHQAETSDGYQEAVNQNPGVFSNLSEMNKQVTLNLQSQRNAREN